MKKQVKKEAKKISLEFLFASLLFLISIFIFAIISHEVVGENEEGFDLKIFRFLKDLTNDNLISFAKALSFFGSHYFLIPAYIFIIIFLFIKQKKSIAVDVMIVSISSTALIFLLKNIFQRHRPKLPLIRELSGYSFPSGHALDSFIFCSMLIYVLWQSKRSITWKYIFAIALLLFSLLIGASRIILRYHYASDVMAGFALAFAWVFLFFGVMKKIKRKN